MNLLIFYLFSPSFVHAALRNGIGGEYILNGKYMVAHHKVIVQPGLTIEYSGPESVIERLNSSRPIAFDLILEVIINDKIKKN